MPRFVILEHDHPELHFDLMLECGDTLRSWRLLGLPTLETSVPAEPTPAHRRLYLNYEGPVSGNRGTVRRYDAGEFTLLDEETGVTVLLLGDRVQGRLSLPAHGTGFASLAAS